MVVTCAGCQHPIVDRFLLNVLDQAWHVTCVRCVDCKCQMAEKCFSRDGKLYCKEDFFRRFGTKCSGCSLGISPHDLVRRARNKVYHVNCFVCIFCHKQLSTGDELYVLDENKFICKKDFLNSKYLLNDDGLSETEDDFDSDAAGLMSDRIKMDADNFLCKQREFDDDDDENDESRDLLRHPLTAADCNSRTVLDSIISDALESDLTPDLGAGDVHDTQDDSNMSCSNSCSSDTSQTNNNNNNNDKDEHGSKEGSNGCDGGSSAGGGGVMAGAKRRGPRTTIKAKQLETLKSAFAATPKPTRHIREQLAQETGLNMRVIQVWFQNRRSKERRMKQLSALGARRQFFRNPRRLRILRPGEELVDSPHDLAASYGFFSDGGDYFPAYPPHHHPASIYGDFYPHQIPGMDPMTGNPVLNFLPRPTGQPNSMPHVLVDQIQGRLRVNEMPMEMQGGGHNLQTSLDSQNQPSSMIIPSDGPYAIQQQPSQQSQQQQHQQQHQQRQQQQQTTPEHSVYDRMGHINQSLLPTSVNLSTALTPISNLTTVAADGPW